MQAEIDKIDTSLEIKLLGVNETGHESGNEENCRDRIIPWLQDTQDDDVWGSWDVTFRDVVILDDENVQVAVYNLTEYSLLDSANYDSLKTLLTDLANEAGE